MINFKEKALYSLLSIVTDWSYCEDFIIVLANRKGYITGLRISISKEYNKEPDIFIEWDILYKKRLKDYNIKLISNRENIEDISPSNFRLVYWSIFCEISLNYKKNHVKEAKKYIRCLKCLRRLNIWSY